MKHIIKFKFLTYTAKQWNCLSFRFQTMHQKSGQGELKDAELRCPESTPGKGKVLRTNIKKQISILLDNVLHWDFFIVDILKMPVVQKCTQPKILGGYL